MEEIKQEILSLSERYSVKCVESAALEEQLSDNEAADTCSTKHSAAGCQVNITYFRSGRRKTDLKLVIFIWINKL